MEFVPSYFHHFPLARAIHEASPDLKNEERDSTSGWESVQSLISRSMNAGREIIMDLQTTYLRKRNGFLFQISA